MALDTEDKRRAILGVYAVADGTVDPLDRPHFIDLPRLDYAEAIAGIAPVILAGRLALGPGLERPLGFVRKLGGRLRDGT